MVGSDTMDSRMGKYYQTDDQAIPKRVEKNAELYQKVNSTEITDFNLNSNVKVIEDEAKNINVNELRDIIKRQYHDEPKRKSINIDLEDDVIIAPDLDEPTKEYDINAILDKAREDQKGTYEEDRLRKVRNTQYDILKDLSLSKLKEEPKKDEQDLMTLINTITQAEFEKEENGEPLNILTDLKGSDNTEVIEGIREATNQIYADLINDEEDVDDSFYTASVDLQDKDFGDEEYDKKSRPLVTFLMIIVILALLAGITYLLDSIFEWGLLS